MNGRSEWEKKIRDTAARNAFTFIVIAIFFMITWALIIVQIITEGR